ncbi:ComEC/Rec2 family competence protein [Olsenella sp. AM04-33]|uniref:ComEC/Rec2 family competence protein n=1 Tax=Olsenella sp. AM04-33 TaxID=2292049 RepID=UPI000E52E3F3|nr:ComEC/Rec2 family competence protein [Olsenella sp. AM04-33]RHK04969.1 MBL fold metallo-hydrolase [Olsenella sp. AM04-33]
MSEGGEAIATVAASSRTADARMPVRPAIPMTLWGLVAVILAERAVLRFGMQLSLVLLVVTAVAGVCLCLLATFAIRRKARGRDTAHVPAVLPFALAATLSGALLGRLALARVVAAVAALSTSSVSAWSLEVEGDMAEGGRGWWGRARVLDESGGKVGAVWLSSPARLECGSAVSCVGRFKPIDDDEWGVSSRMQGLAGTVSVVHVTAVREAGGPLGAVLRMRQAVLASFSPDESDGAAVLAGSVCGDRAPIRSRGLDDAFATCGVSHLVAVSGGHLAILAGTLAALLGKTRLGPGVRGSLALGVIALFIVFCGAPASAVRAGIMSCVSFGGSLVGRRSHALSSTCAAALAMALLDPYVSGQLGFLLSVASVVGICLFGSYASHALDVLTCMPRHPGRHKPALAHTLGRLRSNACDALGVSVVAQLFTLPLTCPAFGEVSLIAPIANLVLAPLFAGLVSLGLAAAALTPLSALQFPVLAAAEGVSQAFCVVLCALARLPLACLPMEASAVPMLAILCAASAALYGAWPTPRKRILLRGAAVLAGGSVALLLGLRLLQPARVCVLDVGQGDAILVADGSTAVLVDTGPDEKVSQALARQGIIHLDAIVLTHLHDDHVGGVDDLVGRVGCNRVLVAGGVSEQIPEDLSASITKLSGHAAEEISCGDTIRVGSFSLRVVSPTEPVDGGENADSLELALTYEHNGNGLSGLLTGDAEKDETAACLARGDVGDIDFLKVGHHGSEVSLTADEAVLLNPEVSVASAGEGNKYGHPRKECMDVLSGAGSVFLCTKDVGTVTVKPGARGPMVFTERTPGGGAAALTSGL